ncbi:beta-1,6-N-acetylglucosaminyltransferase [Pedobacter heparinus]|uniref:Peptide O-xylosyltransferase n=1 Tax=Pedobacter heparinus (strain ATCC 13125 / DSM 2366 / CIP 104194 / JCM 7457 / NBRC 12017 / NCIMB 9290 / NRRL B-14731 / HIM 762-3) TaxID=485917 RepID=C6XWA2_PEDHD|nr:beta-1,6-N-acetylglucosaminyltransferase [Pedobacter heparinus]ACU04181.1 glycosyl transferase family 14 [Pedobacter heparinus DSM 2366]
MRIAHIILAHKNPAQLLRLTKKLEHKMSDIYLHIDAKVPIAPFESIIRGSQIFFIKNRVNCNWGGFSLLDTIIKSLQQVINGNVRYDFINLISAQDYPLMNAEDMYNFLEKRMGKIFISYDTSPNSEWWQHARKRYERYHLTDYSFTGKYFVQKIINIFFRKRSFPLNVPMYGGNKSCWWTITGDSAAYLLNQLDPKSKLYKFLRYCWGSEEFVISTLLMNSQFSTQVVNENYRYIDWSEGKSSPKLLLVEDLQAIQASKMLFARKFDNEIDVKVMDLLDNDSASH